MNSHQVPDWAHQGPALDAYGAVGAALGTLVRAVENAAAARAAREVNALKQLLVEAGNYVRDAGSDEDPETQRLSRELWARIRAAVPEAGLPE